nr:hypothetical protein [Noviherbaspirillum pedocola]
MALSGSDYQRVGAMRIHLIHLRPRAQQRLHDGEMTVLASDYQCSAVVCIDLIYPRPFLQQPLYHIEASIFASGNQRGVAAPVCLMQLFAGRRLPGLALYATV